MGNSMQMCKCICKREEQDPQDKTDINFYEDAKEQNELEQEKAKTINAKSSNKNFETPNNQNIPVINIESDNNTDYRFAITSPMNKNMTTSARQIETGGDPYYSTNNDVNIYK
jgi:hypothetical protein